jgi:15-hydroxyprostaglandin dehydrogenase (NAD)
MAPPTAIITGGSSGIGLALIKHLLSLGWAVAIADISPPKEELPNTIFVKTDISSWPQQANLFEKTYGWQGRLDFFAANAGIDDRDDIFHSLSLDPTKPPKQPNMLCFNVNLAGQYYGIKLAAHYMTLPSTGAGKTKPGGKIVVTSSAAGIYPSPFAPQYAASKQALVGLVRSLAPLSTEHNITINAVCPALVRTGLAPPGLLEQFKEEQFTPMETMLQCFSALADFESVGKEGWVEAGKNGETVEGNLTELIWHQAPAPPPEKSYQDEEGQKAWASIYHERNRKFAEEDWSAKTES